MRSAARARPEPGAQQEKEGASAAGGTRQAAGRGRAPLPLAPGPEGREANQRVQEEPSPPRDSFIGLARTAQLAGDPAPPPSPQTRAEDRRSQVAEKGELGTCPASRFPRRIHGYLFAQVAGPFLRATPSTASRAYHRGQQLCILTSTAERQRSGKISLPTVPCGETPLGLRAGAPNPKSFDFCQGELRLGWKMGGRQAGFALNEGITM